MKVLLIVLQLFLVFSQHSRVESVSTGSQGFLSFKHKKSQPETATESPSSSLVNEAPVLSDPIVSIVFIRHGASTSKFAMLSPDEYKPLRLEDSSFSTLTPLGESQLWSYGRQIKNELKLDILQMHNQIQFFIPNYQKSSASAHSIISGMHNTVPFSNSNSRLYDHPFFQELLENRGQCYQCPLGSGFPVEDYQNGLVTPETDSNYVEDYLITVLEDSIIDPDDSCNLLKKMMYNEQTANRLNLIAFELLGENTEEILKDLDDFIAGLTLSEEAQKDQRFEGLFFKLRFLFSEVISKHQVHMLPEINGLPQSLKKLISKEVYLELYRAEFFELDYQNDFMANLWVSGLIKKIFVYIDKSLMKESFPQINFYTVHNNIIAAVLYHFVGKEKFKKNFKELLPQYSSSVRLDVAVDSKGTHFVTMNVNGKATPISGCGKNCTLEAFKLLLASLIIENYDEICLVGLEM